MKLVINISKIKKLPLKYINCKILDFSSTIDKRNSHSINLNELLNKEELYSSAVKSYTGLVDQCIMKLVSKNTLNFEGNSLFWYTPFSEKHPINGWEYTYFLFLEFLKSDNILLLEEYSDVVIIIPRNNFFVESEVRDLLRKRIKNENIRFLNIGKIERPKFYKLIKSCVKTIYLYNKNISISTQNGIEKSKIYYLFRDSNSISKSSTFKNLKRGFELNNKSIDSLPILNWSTLNKKTFFNEELIAKKLNLFQLCAFFISTTMSYWKCILTARKKIEYKGLNYNLGAISNEMCAALIKDCSLFLMIYWFKRNRINNVFNIFFYEDEFYVFGRLLSTIFESEKNKLYGVQHGYFSLIHTVYSISKTEVNLGIPLPNKFIVWGEYFKMQIQLTSGLPDSFFLNLGASMLIKLSEKNYNDKSAKSKILYCTTTIDCFREEFKIFKEYFIATKEPLCVRLHPLGHVSKADVIELIKDSFEFYFDEELDVIESILGSKVVLTSAHSTIFIDAILNNIPVIRMHTSRFVPVIADEELIIDMYSVQELFDFMTNTKKRINYNIFNNQNFICLNSKSWVTFIQKIV